ncbi:hypothetical protein DOTSEDRAFT_51529 [Dothistroma septosporum NZE10]|uniref:Heterokaryon incompatibility domain-containing protein n=1 Tax=Dothistroma septosporum (strain NZE10 / CBS 128990) TaxID=675120 RepID=N1PR97_DOTSN|nr:hypothetical protein DOTSEDRAFT_51529 [Dothistroma septosporum NZE10]
MTTRQASAGALAAVRRMRLRDRQRVYWIDAICINQHDLVEKGWQVASMGRVYINGTGNLIYLGEAETIKARTCAATLRRLIKKVQDAALLLTGDDLASWENHSFPDCWRYTGIITANDVKGLEIMYHEAWFTRLWVIQELALASKNTCYWGDACLPLFEVLVVTIIVTKANTIESRLALKLLELSYMWYCLHLYIPTKRRADRRMEWYRLYGLATTLSVTEHRDHVHAFLGLVQAIHYPGRLLPRLIVPTYEKTVDEVFRDATRHVLKTEDDYLMSFIGHEHENDMNQLANVQAIRGLAEDIFGFGTDLSLSQVIGRNTAFLLTCGNLSYELRPFENSAQLTQGMANLLHSEQDDSPTELTELGQRFHKLVRNTAWNRTFFATDTGHSGSGPKLTRKGDVAFIMLGGEFVHVLRPVKDDYLYVGAAYVDGMMNGEVFDLGVEPEWVDIR